MPLSRDKIRDKIENKILEDRVLRLMSKSQTIKKKKEQLPTRLSRLEPEIIFSEEPYMSHMVIDEAQRAVAESLDQPLENIPHFETPPPEINADIGLPLFPLAKILRQNPTEIARNLSKEIALPENSLVEKAEAVGPYLNLHLNIEHYGQRVLEQILERKESYGAENLGKGKKIIIDMSSPNIAKPMSVGHLRSTVIGHSVARILEFTGHSVIKDNHLGDWGSQFGMLLKAIELWGNETPEIYQEGKEVNGLLELYVRIHDEVENAKHTEVERMKELVKVQGLSAVEGLEKIYQEAYADTGSKEQAMEEALTKLTPETELETAGREWFKRLEQGDEEAKKQWQWVMGLSMREFEEVYQLLGVDFDYALGESFYSNMLNDVVKKVKSQSFVKEDDGAVVADLGEALGKVVIQTRDGRSLYVTRDLATAIFRSETFKVDRILYVVGAEQKFYFQQWFEILRRMKYPIADKCEHIYFGMMTLPEGKMSSRKGRVVFLRDVIDEGIKRAEEVIKEKNSELFADESKRNKIAQQVAVGAIIWSDVSKDMKRDIVFNWDEMLSFEGYSAPYVQYAHARAQSILNKAAREGIKTETLRELKVATPFERNLIKLLADFPSTVKLSAKNYNPVLIAEYVYKLARNFNKFHKECFVLGEKNKEIRQSRLLITKATTQVIRNALYLLGIEVPEKM